MVLAHVLHYLALWEWPDAYRLAVLEALLNVWGNRPLGRLPITCGGRSQGPFDI